MIVSESTKRFTGKERDEGMGMDNFLARYYSAPVGRFTSPDAPFADQGAEDPQSWNLYSYVRSNPLIFTDRDGRKCVKRLNEDGDACFEIDVKPKEKPDVKLDSDLFWSMVRGVNQAAPAIDYAGQGLMLFGSVVAPIPMAVAQCGAGNCDTADLAMAMLPLPRGALKVLGALAPLAETKVANAVRLRGGGAAQVNKIATWLQQMPLGEVAKLAAEGNSEAVTAVKIVKDAARLAQK
ncbi:MAG: RHS repeat-associated core domain-containing protein [Bryobacter sp.]|jgi:RHS repeat-associated protein|nr:RHS repeat-associated core domain-containing protein [Bryobacter sp. CoA8 C33]